MAPVAPTAKAAVAPAAPIERVDHLITFRFRSLGKRYTRSLVVPAPRGTSIEALIAQARRDWPEGAGALKPFARPESVAEVAEGPITTDTTVRFRR